MDKDKQRALATALVKTALATHNLMACLSATGEQFKALAQLVEGAELPADQQDLLMDLLRLTEQSATGLVVGLSQCRADLGLTDSAATS